MAKNDIEQNSKLNPLGIDRSQKDFPLFAPNPFPQEILDVMQEIQLKIATQGRLFTPDLQEIFSRESIKPLENTLISHLRDLDISLPIETLEEASFSNQEKGKSPSEFQIPDLPEFNDPIKEPKIAKPFQLDQEVLNQLVDSIQSGLISNQDLNHFLAENGLEDYQKDLHRLLGGEWEGSELEPLFANWVEEILEKPEFLQRENFSQFLAEKNSTHLEDEFREYLKELGLLFDEPPPEMGDPDLVEMVEPQPPTEQPVPAFNFETFSQNLLKIHQKKGYLSFEDLEIITENPDLMEYNDQLFPFLETVGIQLTSEEEEKLKKQDSDPLFQKFFIKGQKQGYLLQSDLTPFSNQFHYLKILSHLKKRLKSIGIPITNSPPENPSHTDESNANLQPYFKDPFPQEEKDENYEKTETDSAPTPNNGDESEGDGDGEGEEGEKEEYDPFNIKEFLNGLLNEFNKYGGISPSSLWPVQKEAKRRKFLPEIYQFFKANQIPTQAIGMGQPAQEPESPPQEILTEPITEPTPLLESNPEKSHPEVTIPDPQNHPQGPPLPPLEPTPPPKKSDFSDFQQIMTQAVVQRKTTPPPKVATPPKTGWKQKGEKLWKNWNFSPLTVLGILLLTGLIYYKLNPPQSPFTYVGEQDVKGQWILENHQSESGMRNFKVRIPSWQLGQFIGLRETNIMGPGKVVPGFIRQYDKGEENGETIMIVSPRQGIPDYLKELYIENTLRKCQVFDVKKDLFSKNEKGEWILPTTEGPLRPLIINESRDKIRVALPERGTADKIILEKGTK